MRYGLPYMGSKNKIADWVVDCLPPAEHFYDLFCGGCAVTHAALLRHKYKTYHVNDITNMGYVFQKLVTEEYKPDYRWVSREEFEVNKEKDILMALCWSFGNDGNEYLYGKDIEPIKKACHYAVCFEDYALADELGIDLHKLDGIGDIQKRYSAYKKLWREKYAVRPDLGGGGTYNVNERLFQLERINNFGCNYGGVIATKGDYQDVEVAPGSVVYCDCPYKNTHTYKNSQDSFDHERFYEWCLSREHPVFVSEYQMPSEFKPIARKTRVGSMSAKGGKELRMETLFVQARFSEHYKRDLFI